MAGLRAFVHATRQQLLTALLALESLLHRALEGLPGFSTATRSLNRRLADGMRSRMTQELTRMHAIVSSSAHLAARVSEVVPIHGRILLLAAETNVVLGRFESQVLASDASPLARLSLRIVDPRPDAVEMLDAIAVRAVPDRLVVSDFITADHALQVVVFDVLGQLLALGNHRRLNGVFFLQLNWGLWWLPLRVALLIVFSAVSSRTVIPSVFPLATVVSSNFRSFFFPEVVSSKIL